jgi:hypothetical protein
MDIIIVRCEWICGRQQCHDKNTVYILYGGLIHGGWGLLIFVGAYIGERALIYSEVYGIHMNAMHTRHVKTMPKRTKT